MSKITKSARMEDCTVRLPGVCRNNIETTVYAHFNQLRFGKGKGIKAKFGAYACFDCHQVLDGAKTSLPDHEVYTAFLEAGYETLMKLEAKGLVKI